MFSRRQFLAAGSAATTLLGTQGLLPVWARTGAAGAAQTEFDLAIRQQRLNIGGREALATTVDGTLPGPLLRMREGENVVLRVRNELDVDSSLHWHGILLPPGMDGVPGISFDGIQPGETFEYRYRLQQAGTYWYHSHSGFQEQAGVYAPLIVDPAGAEPAEYDRELVILLSDWSFEDPARVYARLKKQGDYYNRNQPSLLGLMRSRRGFGAALREQLEWDRMRMSPTDIADVTGYTYTYLMNGHAPADGFTGLYEPGERIRLRLINASAMTYFNFRIPGLPLTVIQSDGQNVRPVTVDELQIAVAETYDVIVTPPGEQAWPLMAESMGRSGCAFGSLTPRADLHASTPPLRDRPRRSMADMGHGHDMHEAMTQDAENAMAGGEPPNAADHAAMGHGAATPTAAAGSGGRRVANAGSAHTAVDHAAMGHAMPGGPATRGPVVAPIQEPGWQPRRGPGVTNIVAEPTRRIAEPGTGLGDMEHRVLTYADLSASEAFYDQRPPTREITLHLTGNMERYMWSFDGERFSSRVEPVRLIYGERVRLVFINHTMMEHPIHLHGMWMELENGQTPLPRKHTISVKPAERLSVLVSADAEGEWAFHCHLLLHMKAGMMRRVVVAPPGGSDNV
jgi:CopA family copper-resistance protein